MLYRAIRELPTTNVNCLCSPVFTIFRTHRSAAFSGARQAP